MNNGFSRKKIKYLEKEKIKEKIKKIRENGLPNNLRPFCGPTAEASNEKSSKLLIRKSIIQTDIRAIISLFSHENMWSQLCIIWFNQESFWGLTWKLYAVMLEQPQFVWNEVQCQLAWTSTHKHWRDSSLVFLDFQTFPLRHWI